MKVGMALVGVCLASTLVFSSAFAASPLVAGKPAGVKQAQLETSTVIPLLAGAALIAGIVVVASEQGKVNSPASTSTSP